MTFIDDVMGGPSKDRPTIPDLKVVDAGVGVGVSWMFSSDDHPLWSHWCTKWGHWVNMHTPNHLVSSKEPLTLVGSLICNDCGLHGFIRESKWVSA